MFITGCRIQCFGRKIVCHTLRLFVRQPSTQKESCRYLSSEYSGMELSKVVQRLHKIASPSLAGSWDNVGLLVEPSAPHQVNRILLTNDLTPPVLEEAISKKSDMIISYHPPIFSPLKRLTQKKWKEMLMVRCIENKIAVFSPHTSYDCVEGGVNDWLISCFDNKEVKPVELHKEFPSNNTSKLTFDVPQETAAELSDGLKTIQQVTVTNCSQSEAGDCHVSVACPDSILLPVMGLLNTYKGVVKNLETVSLSQVPKPGYGMGRKSSLNSAISIDEAVAKVKSHLKLDHVRLARVPVNPLVSSVAVCAGSGGSVLGNVKADLYLTGEMSHHEVLHAVYNGSAVILCDHSNTERGYLTVLQSRLKDSLNSEVEVKISETDCDPLKIV